MTTRNGAAGAADGASRGLLKERAYEEIKRRLLAGEFPPGSFLAERQLAGLLGMSKTPVKAALGRLGDGGFITVSPPQGIGGGGAGGPRRAGLFGSRGAPAGQTPP